MTHIVNNQIDRRIPILYNGIKLIYWHIKKVNYIEDLNEENKYQIKKYYLNLKREELQNLK